MLFFSIGIRNVGGTKLELLAYVLVIVYCSPFDVKHNPKHYLKCNKNKFRTYYNAWMIANMIA